MGTRHGSAGQPGKVPGAREQSRVLLASARARGRGMQAVLRAPHVPRRPGRPALSAAGRPAFLPLAHLRQEGQRPTRPSPKAAFHPSSPPAGPRKWQRREINPQGGCRPEFPFPHHDVLRKSNSLYCPAVWLYLVQRNGTCDARESSIRILQSLGKVYRDTAVQQLLPLWLVRWHAP